MRNYWNWKMEYAQNASKLHRKVGEILQLTSPFSGSELRQEAIVSDIFPEYTNNRDKYDWTLPSLFVITECHGIQHYQVQTFGKEASEANEGSLIPRGLYMIPIEYQGR